MITPTLFAVPRLMVMFTRPSLPVEGSARFGWDDKHLSYIRDSVHTMIIIMICIHLAAICLCDGCFAGRGYHTSDFSVL